MPDFKHFFLTNTATSEKYTATRGVATVLPRSRPVRGDVRSRRCGDESPNRGRAKLASGCVGVRGGCESGVAVGRCRRGRQERNRRNQYEPYVRLFDPDKSSIDRED